MLLNIFISFVESGSLRSENFWANSRSLPRGSSQGLTTKVSFLNDRATEGASGRKHARRLQNQRIMRVIEATDVDSLARNPTL